MNISEMFTAPAYHTSCLFLQKSFTERKRACNLVNHGTMSGCKTMSFGNFANVTILAIANRPKITWMWPHLLFYFWD